MKKLLKKIKKLFITILTVFYVLPARVFAAANINPADLQPQYLYGIEEPTSITVIKVILRLFRRILIPIILIIGLIKYFKKDEIKLGKKIIALISAILIYIAIWFSTNILIGII